MPSPTQKPPPLEERLRRAVFPAEANAEFAHRLRRALLAADFYRQPSLRRWLRRTLRLAPVAIGALSVGFLAAVGLGAPAPAPSSVVPAAAVTVVNPTSLERLGREGRLHYVSSQPDGIRVYRVQLASGEILELLDHAPYAIGAAGVNGQ